MDSDSNPSRADPGSRLAPMFRSSTTGGDGLKFDEDMGPQMKTSGKAARAAKALAELNKGDDKLTRKSEEQVNKVTRFKILFQPHDDVRYPTIVTNVTQYMIGTSVF